MSFADDGECLAVAEGETYSLEERDGNDVLRVGRRISIDAYGIQHVPRRHLTSIVHACIGKVLGSHPVIVVHQSVQHMLGFLLLVNEIIGVGDAVPGLVAMTVGA